MDSDDGSTKATVCKTISCLLPTDLEVKRACQLTEFLLEPTVDAYYAVETLYNEPDQKLEEESMPVPNSLRCELLLVFKTQWPFDPEFWDWRTLKRHCLALMGEEASIVSSIDLLNDTEEPEEEEDNFFSQDGLKSISDHSVSGTYELTDITDKRQKNREMKKLREKGFISSRFRNWQAYMQYCVLCDKEFLGHRIVRHAQTHMSSGVYSCPICAQTFPSKDTLIPHVTSHVKQSSKERLTAMKTNQKLTGSKTTDPVMVALKAKTENKLKEIVDTQGQNGGFVPQAEARVASCHTQINDDNVCPVGKCRRTFKFFKNLVAHVKAHGDDEEAKTFLEMHSKKVVCQYCRRHFISVTHLNDHLQVHCGVKPYICIQLNCKASFLSNTELLTHRKTHSVFKARCMFPNCGKIFSEAFKLYDHEAQHYKTFTCKVLDCGKVFHSQKQLDLHQDKHAAREEEGQPEQKQPVSTLREQMLSNHTSIPPETSLLKWKTESAVNPDPEKLPMSNGSLLKASQAPVDTLGQYRGELEPQNALLSTSQTQSLTNSVIQPVNSNLSDINGHRESLGDQSFDYMRSPQSHDYDTDASRGQPQMFLSNVNTVSTPYDSDCNLPSSGQQRQMCSSDLSPTLPNQNSIGPAISQLLPATVTPQPLTGGRPENSPMPLVSTGPPLGQRERYHCAFETCTRHYSSQRSVTKHMKAVHPDFYEQWKVVRTKIKVTYLPAQKTSPVGQLNSGALLENRQGNGMAIYGDPRKNVIQSPPYANMDTSTKYAAMHACSSSAQNHNASLLMENVLNPIVLSQLGSITNQDSQKWHSAPGNEQIENCASSQIFPSNMQVTSQANSTNATLPLSLPSCSMMTAPMNRPAESLQSPLLENASQLGLPLYMDGAKEVSQQPYASQVQGSLVFGSSAPEKIKMMQQNVESSCLSQDGASSKTKKQPQKDPANPENDPENQRRARRSKRTKWPAIVRDGKFVCCRCFRQFNCPKSLGGHLSKRTVCKPYDDDELNTELPMLFFDMLNSEQERVGTAQPQLSFNPTAAYQEKSQQSGTNGSSVVSLDYPQDNLLVYGNGEPNDNIMKQSKNEATISDLFARAPSPQTLFQNLCSRVPYVACERLTGSSVIQHTENAQVKDTSYGTPHYPQPSVDTFTGSVFPDPLLSQILTETPSTAVPGGANHSEGYHSEGFNSETPIQTLPVPNTATQTWLPDNQFSSPMNGKRAETQRKTTEQDIKKRLREQILAGESQRRTSQSSNMDSKGKLKNPMSFGSVYGPSSNSELEQMSSDAKSNSATQEKFATIPGTFGEIEHLLKTQSFTCFRETSSPKPEALSLTDVANNADLEPTQLSASQLQWMAEIQSAFERLDLVRELSSQMSPSTEQSSNAVISQAGPATVELHSLVSSKFIKPFVCENENCTFSSMSSEALWKHLSKTHSYTLEMVNVVKKKYGQYAPFKCQKCSKTFTRNSNLRAHYQSAHKLSVKEIEVLDMRRRQAKAAASAAIQASLQAAVKRDCPSQAFDPRANTDISNKKYQDVNPLIRIHPLQTAMPQASGPLLVNQSVNSLATVKPIIEITKKIKDKKPNSGNATSPYRPYRCVHQGCEAAFTIQHNLILHYRAVHQSALSALEVNKDQDQRDGLDDVKNQEEEEDPEAEVLHVSEFRCQVKDCSRVFQEAPNLLQHYLQLHEFGLDKVGILLSGIKSGKFACGHQGCTVPFTTFWKYLGHVKEQHKDMLAKPEQLNGSFRCEIEGCDRSYATKSNMLRHVMKKHQELYQSKLKNQQIKEDGMKPSSKNLHYQLAKTSNGKENIESNKKILQRGNDTKRESKAKNNHWTKYGKPSLKSKVEASSMCTKKFPLQYPCMIKGCESVMKSERSILKHYMGHGLSEKYLEQQRSHFIFCKKVPRQKCRSIRSDDSKSDNTSDLSDNDLTEEPDREGAEYGCSKPVLRKRISAETPAALHKLSNDDSSDGSVVLKRKRGRPRKLIEKIVKRKKIPRTTKVAIVYSRDDESDSSCPAVMQEDMTEPSAPLASFKPMGFEMSFLKFLEQSNKCEHPPRRKVDVLDTSSKTSNLSTKDTCVRFRNHQNLKSLSRVKMVIDGAFSGVVDLMLKQLQDMQPTVVLGKGDMF